MSKSSVLLIGLVVLLVGILLVGCNGRNDPTPVPSPLPGETGTLAPTPTLSGEEVTATVPAATPSPAATATGAAPTATATNTPQAADEATATPAEAQGTEQRISFGAGETSAAVENAVVSGTRDRYLVGAAAGQVMTLEITSLEENAEFQVLAPDGSELGGVAEADGGVWQRQLPQSGDYEIVVGPTRGNATYRLVVTIPPAPDVEATRILFEPGMAGAQVAGHVEAGESVVYVLGAVEDQSLSVSAYAQTEPLVMEVRGADGTVLLPLEAEQNGLYMLALPATMDYYVEIQTRGATTDFQLDVSATPLADLPQRIELQAGESETVAGTLDMGGDLASYILRLSEGDTVIVEASPADAPLNVYLQSEDGVDFFFAVDGVLETQVPRTLDYVLTVSTPNAAGVTDYELRISVE